MSSNFFNNEFGKKTRVDYGSQRRITILHNGGVIGTGWARWVNNHVDFQDIVDLKGEAIPHGDYDIQYLDEDPTPIVIPRRVQ